MSFPRTTIIDKNGNLAVVDSEVGGLLCVDQVVHAIHAGTFFEATYYVSSLANGANLDILIQTSSRPPHLRGAVACNGSARVSFYEDVSASNVGTPIPVRNRNRISTRVTQTGVYHTPTVEQTGTLLTDNLLSGGTSGGNRTVGSNLNTFEEFVLKPNSVYLIRLNNISGQAAAASSAITMFEAL